MPDRKLEIKFMEGGPMILPTDPPIALCRCTHSKNKPYCDGTHAQVLDQWQQPLDLPDFTLIIPLATIDTNGGD